MIQCVSKEPSALAEISSERAIPLLMESSLSGQRACLGTERTFRLDATWHGFGGTNTTVPTVHPSIEGVPQVGAIH